MAAPRSRTQTRESDSSSSDDEQRERLKEAAWLPPAVEKSVQHQQNPVTPIIQSLRAQPDNHEHDGNELQTTPEFRAHVARKLAALLDSCIKETPGSSSLKDPEVESEAEDECFRLFSTSVPGDTGTAASNLPAKRRAAYSSSEDSEEENRRCREAAVSGLDILKQSALPPVPVETSHAPNYDQITKKHKKKKKKKKMHVGEGTELEQPEIMQGHISNGFKKKKIKHLSDVTESDHQDLQQEQEPSSLTKKKKKHKPLGDDTELEHQDLEQERELCDIKKKKMKKHKHLGGAVR